tara:strand:+ start:1963 stop:2073 length:111 start_codon:yes stop_codon:yes gene_type:complete
MKLVRPNKHHHSFFPIFIGFFGIYSFGEPTAAAVGS